MNQTIGSDRHIGGELRFLWWLVLAGTLVAVVYAASRLAYQHWLSGVPVAVVAAVVALGLRVTCDRVFGVHT